MQETKYENYVKLSLPDWLGPWKRSFAKSLVVFNPHCSLILGSIVKKYLQV